MFDVAEFLADALEGDSPEARIRWCIEQLAKDRKHLIEALKHEADYWAKYFDHQARHCDRLLRDNDKHCGFSSSGVVQGNVDKFDNIAIRLVNTEQLLEGLKKNLLPEEKAPLVTASSGQIKKKGKK